MKEKHKMLRSVLLIQVSRPLLMDILIQNLSLMLGSDDPSRPLWKHLRKLI